MELAKYVPGGASLTIEERIHRGAPVYALVANVPGGASVPINGYSTYELAESTARKIADFLFMRDGSVCAIERL